MLERTDIRNGHDALFAVVGKRPFYWALCINHWPFEYGSFFRAFEGPAQATSPCVEHRLSSSFVDIVEGLAKEQRSRSRTPLTKELESHKGGACNDDGASEKDSSKASVRADKS